MNTSKQKFSSRFFGYLFVAFALLISLSNASAQCSGGTYAGTVTPTTSWQPVTNIIANTYYTFTATAGATYYFSFCPGDGGSTSYDSQITILDDATGSYAGGYNDDYCGLSSYVSWTAPSSVTYRILLSQYYCYSASTVNLGTMVYKMTAAPAPMCYSITSVPYLPDPFTGTAVSLGDDQYSGVIDMGFSFCYDGNTYTQLLIASNGYITFNTSTPYWGAPYYIGAAIPSASDPVNSVLAPWEDLYPPAGGSITYALYGTSPNQRFVVSWYNVPMYACNTSLVTAQVTLYEGSNNIQVLVGSKPICYWNGGNAIEGLQNINGTQAVAVPGRNYPTQWTGNNDGYLFTPTCGSCTTVLPIELLSFTGECNTGKVSLEWTTASEVNNDYFTVERSSDGRRFSAVAVVDGAGSSSEMHTYHLDDNEVTGGLAYYRLKQTDFDGHITYSNIVAAECEKKEEGIIASVYPNPFNDETYITFNDDPDTGRDLVIYTMEGQEVRRIRNITDKQLVIKRNDLGEGMYYFVLTEDNMPKAQGKLIIK